MNILQIGPVNWADQYQLPKSIQWEFNDYPSDKKHNYNAVLVTGKNKLTDDNWCQLQWQVDPYNVIYLAGIKDQLSLAARHFLKYQAAISSTDQPQTIIDNLPKQYFFGQSGMRFAPTNLLPQMNNIQTFELQDADHLLITTDTKEKWQSIGNYKTNVYLDPDRLIKFWLEYQTDHLAVRLRIFIQPSGGNGDPADSFILSLNSLDEVQLPIKMSKEIRFAAVGLEVKGKGKLRLGPLHSRWARAGRGEFITGGQRIVNPANREDIAYYFNPGDLRPPLNVYFSGARGKEGFEAYPLFRNMHTPTILFTDMRLEVGQFYTTSFMEKNIKKIILKYLAQLGFDKSQLIMNGISMGTYPAMKLGAQLGPYAINVAKPLANLGLIAERGRLERPDTFATIFDVDNQLLPSLKLSQLQKLDQQFWQSFEKTDLSQTRLFVGYMKDDDYDNRTIEYLRHSHSIANAKQFSTNGFAGRHNDDPTITTWFVDRLNQLLRDDFERKP